VDNDPLVLEFNINAAAIFDMQLLESSFDLMQNPLFKMNQRADWMMPTPFVLNDAVAIKKTIKPSPKTIQAPQSNTEQAKPFRKPISPKAVPFVEPKISVDSLKLQ